MDTILFNNVLPQVFAQQANLHSEIWQQEVKFQRGKTYLIEAHSGMGKSTFCSYILGYRHDYTGQVLFDDIDVKNFSVRQWVEHRQTVVSHLFQELRLFPELTTWENIEIKNLLTHHLQPTTITEWLERLGIAHKRDVPVGRMSFGQQQRVAMIRALAQPFQFLLADEPISHLDDKNAAIMTDIMMEEASRQGAAVIVTSIGKHTPLDYDKIYKL